jgi:hypothetical protein
MVRFRLVECIQNIFVAPISRILIGLPSIATLQVGPPSTPKPVVSKKVRGSLVPTMFACYTVGYLTTD